MERFWQRDGSAGPTPADSRNGSRSPTESTRGVKMADGMRPSRRGWNGVNGPVWVRRAESREELEQAYRLVYTSYRRRGYLDENPSGVRLTLFNAMPETVTFESPSKTSTRPRPPPSMVTPSALPVEPTRSTPGFMSMSCSS